MSACAWRSFVAVGDSFTEGLDDPYPDGAGYPGLGRPGRRPARGGGAGRVRVREPGRARPALRRRGGRAGAGRAGACSRIWSASRPAATTCCAGSSTRPRWWPASTTSSAGCGPPAPTCVLFRFADVTARLPGQRLIGPRVAVLNRGGGRDRRSGTAPGWSTCGADDEFPNPLLWSERPAAPVGRRAPPGRRARAHRAGRRRPTRRGWPRRTARRRAPWLAARARRRCAGPASTSRPGSSAGSPAAPSGDTVPPKRPSLDAARATDPGRLRPGRRPDRRVRIEPWLRRRGLLARGRRDGRRRRGVPAAALAACAQDGRRPAGGGRGRRRSTRRAGTAYGRSSRCGPTSPIWPRSSSPRHPAIVRDGDRPAPAGARRRPVRLPRQPTRRGWTRRRPRGGARTSDTWRGQIALTDSTTMGLGLLYTGLRLRAGDEVLTTEHDFYATHESLRLRAARDGVDRAPGAALRRPGQGQHRRDRAARCWRAVAAADPDRRGHLGALQHRREAADPGDRRRAARAKQLRGAALRRRRARVRRARTPTPTQLGCDFLVSGCHKWLFGPRGTGLVWGSSAGWERFTPVIPAVRADQHRHWMGLSAATVPPGRPRPRAATTASSTAGRWPRRSTFHQRLGRARVAARTRELATALKDGLAGIAGVRLATPRCRRSCPPASCAARCRRSRPGEAVDRLRERR